MGSAFGSSFCEPRLCTCLVVFGIVSRSQEFKSQTDDTTSTECFAWSNSVLKPAERGRWGLPSAENDRSSGTFSTSTMLRETLSFTEEHRQWNSSKALHRKNIPYGSLWALHAICHVSNSIIFCIDPFMALYFNTKQQSSRNLCPNEWMKW